MQEIDRRNLLLTILRGSALVAASAVALPSAAEPAPLDIDQARAANPEGLHALAQVRRRRRRRWVCWWHRGRRVCGWRWRWVWI